MKKMNIFSESLIGAMSVKPNLYASTVETSETDYLSAYAECISLAYSMETSFRLIGSACDAMVGKMSDLEIVLIGEAEGGFLKRILDAILKLFEKVKGFFTALLGRFKSNKSYRDDLAKISSALGTKYNYQDKAEIAVPKHRYMAIASIISKVLSKDSSIFKMKYEGVTVGEIVKSSQAIVGAIENGKGSLQVHGGTLESKVTKPLSKIQSLYPTVDAWVRDVYLDAVGSNPTGDADFNKNKPGTAQEQLNKLFDKESKETVKGSNIGSMANSPFYTEFMQVYSVKGLLDIDNIIAAIEEGESFFKDKADELRDAINELERAGQRSIAANSEKDSDNDKSMAQTASNLASQYSKVVSDYTTVTITVFNASKSLLDRFIAESKTILASIESARSKYGSM